MCLDRTRKLCSNKKKKLLLYLDLIIQLNISYIHSNTTLSLFGKKRTKCNVAAITIINMRISLPLEIMHILNMFFKKLRVTVNLLGYENFINK